MVADPDPGIRRLLRRHFGKAGYTVVTADAGRIALDHIRRNPPDVVILSVSLTDPGGVGLVDRVHNMTRAPMIVLRQAKGSITPGEILDAGADDCLDEPFLLEELAARTRRLLSRAGFSLGPRVLATHIGGLEINTLDRAVRLNGKVITLTRKEFGLLAALAGANGATLSHDEILRQVWGEGDPDARQNLRRVVSSLRRKIEPVPTKPVLLIGIRGSGYQLQALREPREDSTYASESEAARGVKTAHVRPASAGSRTSFRAHSRYPTPGSVTMSAGCSGSLSIFCRSDLT